MAALATHKRRPVAPTKDTQKVEIGTLASLRPEKTVEAYHQLFVNIELLMNTMLDHGIQDEVITMINSARLAQYARNISDLDRYLEEIIASAKRWNAENERIAKAAESELYSPEATVSRMRVDENPQHLHPPESGVVVTLNVTARLSHNLPESSAKILKAEQVYGAFWNIKARCFVVPRMASFGAVAQAFQSYESVRTKLKQRKYRLLTEYRVNQTRYKNVEIYMLVDLPRLVALRDTKILELGMASKEQAHRQDAQERLPIIERAESIVAALPRTVSAESKRYMVHRLAENMLLESKKTRLRLARYKRDGEPAPANPARELLANERFRISTEIAAAINVAPQEIHKAIIDRTFSAYVGQFIRMRGAEGWRWACERRAAWERLRKLQ